MRNKGFIQANKAQYVCTLGKKQPPRSARLSRKKKEYKSRLTSTKLQEASKHIGALDWEVPSADALLENKFFKLIHVAAADCGFDGSIESLVVNWTHPLMLAAKTADSTGDNPNFGASCFLIRIRKGTIHYLLAGRIVAWGVGCRGC